MVSLTTSYAQNALSKYSKIYKEKKAINFYQPIHLVAESYLSVGI